MRAPLPPATAPALAPHRARGRRTLAMLALAGISAYGLTGCASASTGTAPTSPPPAVATPAASTPAAPSSPSATPLGETCDDIMPTSVLDQYASGFTLQSDYTPAAESNAAQILAAGGIACEWIATNDDHLTIAVARPSHVVLTIAETAVGGAGEPTDLFGSEMKAWAAKGGGTFPGQFDVFTPLGTWVSTTSSLYTGPDSTVAQTLVAAVLQALPS